MSTKWTEAVGVTDLHRWVCKYLFGPPGGSGWRGIFERDHGIPYAEGTVQMEVLPPGVRRRYKLSLLNDPRLVEMTSVALVSVKEMRELNLPGWEARALVLESAIERALRGVGTMACLKGRVEQRDDADLTLRLAFEGCAEEIE